MGNVSSRPPSNKLKLLVEETNDLSFSVTSNIIQEAQQNIVSSQTQIVNIDLSELQNCVIDISQTATIMAQQIATFKAVFTNPKELLKQLVSGPNSLLQKALSSNSSVMNGFMNTVKDKFGLDSEGQLKAKITNILKVNIDQNSIQKCSQNIFTSQEQRVSILGKMCKDSNIKISQSTVIDAAQNCIFEVTQNALMEDPTIRMAVRDFNGDYNPELLDDLDAGAKIPDACFNATKTIQIPVPCPPCDCNKTLSTGNRFLRSTQDIEPNSLTENTFYRIIILILIITNIITLYHICKK